MSKTITRSTVNSQEYNAPEFPKSGFNLSYRDYSDYMLGRWQVSGFQYVMPSDNISGNNKGNFTFNRIVTPMVAPTHVGQYNVYTTFRSIDNTFQENVAPSKHNGFSQDWRMPTTNTRYLVDYLMRSYFFADTTYFSTDGDVGKSFMDILYQYYTLNPTTPGVVVSPQMKLIDFLSELGWIVSGGSLIAPSDIAAFLAAATSSSLGTDAPADSSNPNIVSLHAQAVNMYAVDALIDVMDLWKSRFGEQFELIDNNITCGEFFYNFYECLFTPFLGRYSYYADFGYNFIRPSDIYRLAYRDHVDTTNTSSIIDLFDDTPMCEYALRAMYAFWYDRCRDVNLQPVSATLPKPRSFGSTSIFDYDAGGNLIYLLYRIRRWTEDMFISAQPDSPSRHVFAPIYKRDGVVTQNNENDFATDAQEKISSTTIGYLDPVSGTAVSVVCPVPSIVNDSLAALNQSTLALENALPLQALKQAQNLERYLKRLDYFGDEYNDYMLSQYNSRVSDLRINHPEILSQSFDDAAYSQEVANVSTTEGNVGDRTATATISSGGDGYSTFCEEFGIVINVISFMPDGSYDNATPQLLMSRLVDLPLPIFAANNDELGRVMEIAANGLSPALNGDDADFRFMFGHYPAYHAWRSRVDRVRGSFLNERQDCLFRRFYGLVDGITTPKLNYEFINCRPSLQMFANPVRYDCQLYGDVVHDFYVERVLPTPVETI